MNIKSIKLADNDGKNYYNSTTYPKVVFIEMDKTGKDLSVSQILLKIARLPYDIHDRVVTIIHKYGNLVNVESLSEHLLAKGFSVTIEIDKENISSFENVFKRKKYGKLFHLLVRKGA